MNSKDFAIYVMSHERSQQMDTVKSLKKHGYSGKIIVVLDNLDNEIQEYRKKIKELDNAYLYIFNKPEYMEKTDTMDNFHIIGLGVYARTAIAEHAKSCGRKYYAVFDDDIT